MTTKTERFWMIVQKEMDTHGMKSFRELERLGNVSNGTISQRMKDMLPPTINIIHAIARGLDLPCGIVEEWSKGRRPVQNVAMEQRMIHMFRQLPPDKQRDILIQVHALANSDEDLETQPT